jgi:hypothetical protein
MPKAQQKPRPVHKARLGSLQLAVWANEHETESNTHIFHTIMLERNYKDKGDEWQKTTQLRESDLGDAVALLQDAQRFLITEAQ